MKDRETESAEDRYGKCRKQRWKAPRTETENVEKIETESAEDRDRGTGNAEDRDGKRRGQTRKMTSTGMDSDGMPYTKL